jgi:AcrR family transcriptional regulator
VTSARREQLLDVAADLIERDGIDDFGTGTLARAAGIKPPSLYKHFAGLADIENALISREFAAFAREMTDAAAAASDDPHGRLAAFAAAYRRHALARPQLYRLMTARPLDRAAIEPGSEDAAMAPLIALFREDAAQHDVARAAWAWVHGLVILEIAERFPPGADLDASWDILVDMLATRARDETDASST